MDWISLASIAKNHSNDAYVKLRELRSKWDRTPSQDELDELQQNLRSYLLYTDEANSSDHRKIVEGILARPEFFNRAVIVTDGSYLSIRVYAYTVNGKVRIILWASYEDVQEYAQVREYLWDRKHPVEEVLDWILKNYSTIPFQCGTLAQLEEHEQWCNQNESRY
ncbi:MAG: hypothetical protein NC548_05535 [Lachnospiraceae bacterium]|nr:hypothetical protein [Lachnospiraceae bacterium]